MRNSEYVNNKLGIEIFNTDMSLIKYTDKQVKELMIDDLIKSGKPTPRLIKFKQEILKERETTC